MTPRAMRISLQIWAYCDPRGWDCSVKEIAEEIGENWQTVNVICRHRGWLRRLRSETPQERALWENDMRIGVDAALEGEGRRAIISDIVRGVR